MDLSDNRNTLWFYDLIARVPHTRSPVTDQSNAGINRAERIACTLPVNLGNARGITRDISASGVLFETDATYPLLSASMNFEIELDTPNGKILLKCRGTIVRIESRRKRVGIAVNILELSPEPVWLT